MSGNKPYDPAEEGAQMSFDGRTSYGDYLNLDDIRIQNDTTSDTIETQAV